MITNQIRFNCITFHKNYNVIVFLVGKKIKSNQKYVGTGAFIYKQYSGYISPLESMFI